MLRALSTILRLCVSVPVFEFVGAVLLVAAAWGAWSLWAGLAVAGGLSLLKSFDLALTKGQ